METCLRNKQGKKTRILMMENGKEIQKKLVEIEAETDALGVQVSDKSIKTSVRYLTIKVHPYCPLQRGDVGLRKVKKQVDFKIHFK